MYSSTDYLQSEQIRACDSEPLITAGDGPQGILKGVCELMAVQELTRKVYNESDLHAVLEQNILDSCHWVSSFRYNYKLL